MNNGRSEINPFFFILEKFQGAQRHHPGAQGGVENLVAHRGVSGPSGHLFILSLAPTSGVAIPPEVNQKITGAKRPCGFLPHPSAVR